jgi:hypothetical protein
MRCLRKRGLAPNTVPWSNVNPIVQWVHQGLPVERHGIRKFVFQVYLYLNNSIGRCHGWSISIFGIGEEVYQQKAGAYQRKSSGKKSLGEKYKTNTLHVPY